MNTKLIICSSLLISVSSLAMAWDSSAPATRQQINAVGAQAQQQMAAEPYASSDDSWGGIPALPLVVKQVGDIRYINGGVSDEELDQLKNTNGDYNLHLQIAAVGGEYVGDVQVRITSASGAVLTVADAGPFLYVSLKPGSYTVEASGVSGKVQKFKLSAPAKGHVQRVIRVAE